MTKSLYDTIDDSFDGRGINGKRFQFKNFLIYLIIAELAGTNSVRKKEVYLQENRRQLGLVFDTHWHKSPSRAAINSFINTLNQELASVILNCFSSGEKFYRNCV